MSNFYDTLYVETELSHEQSEFHASIFLGSPDLPRVDGQNEQREIRGLSGRVPIPRGSIGNPIDVDAENLDSSGDVRRGDTIDKPIILDGSGATDSSTFDLTRSPGSSIAGSIPIALAHDDSTNDDNALAEYYRCKICHCKTIDMVLGCGHPYCEDCFIIYFHQAALDIIERNRRAFRPETEIQSYKVPCPLCSRTIPGHFAGSDVLNPLGGCFISLDCPYSHHDCFLKGYMVQGIRIKPM